MTGLEKLSLAVTFAILGTLTLLTGSAHAGEAQCTLEYDSDSQPVVLRNFTAFFKKDNVAELFKACYDLAYEEQKFLDDTYRIISVKAIFL